jgi:hypothetical protein
MLRRLDDGDLVLWKPGLTVCFTALPAKRPSPAESVKAFLADADEARFEETLEQRGSLHTAHYRLDEEDDGDTQMGLYGIVAAAKQMLVVAVYFDTKRDAKQALEIFRSVKAR